MLRHIWISSIVLLAAGCASHRPAPGRTQLEEIYYRRTGGLMGTDDRLTIRPDGTFKTSGRMMSTHAGRLTDEQIDELIRLFSKWNELKSNYPPPPRAADTTRVEIRYGGRGVTATDASPDLPEAFANIRNAIETDVGGP